jgi:uracil-DNA glycosylase
MIKIGGGWDEILGDEFKKDYYINLRKKLANEYKNYTIYPNMFDIFNAFKYTDYAAVKAVIIGQDPYHGPNQAHGLSFSVKRGVPAPPSLKNIFKELAADVGFQIPPHGELTKWASEGVMLLNAVLTVRAGSPNSHKSLGWETFTDRAIQLLNEREKPAIFLLWGKSAHEKARFITNPRHFILKAAHPSPLSAHAGFFGCRHFSKTNQILQNFGETPINWQI